MSLRRMVPFLLLNIVVSAITVVIVWNLLGRSAQGTPAAVESVATITGQAVVADTQATPAADGVVQESAPVDAEPTAPAAEDAAVVHVVAQGDTLGRLSLEYDVAVEDIVQVNNLASADSIFVGQRLVMPVGGIPVPTAEPTAEVTPTPLPTVAFAVGESTLEISAVEAVGDQALERVVISNVGANPVALGGWTLSDDLGNTYTFPEVTLFNGGASVTVHTRDGGDTGIEFYWRNPQAVWASGKTAVLRDAAGNIQAQTTIP